MYSIVLMMAVSNGAAQPAVSPDADFARTARYGNHLTEKVDKKGCKGCSGCYGCYGCSGCYGCYGCYGGYSCYGCHGCYGGGYVSWGCGGCHGGYVSWGCGGCHGGVVIIGGAGGTAKPKTDDKKPKKEEEEANDPTRATLLVTLPADARLTIDDEPTTSTSSSRSFVTPPLEGDKDFRYTLKAQVMRDGKPLSVTRDVTVRAGRTTNVNLDFSQASVAQK